MMRPSSIMISRGQLLSGYHVSVVEEETSSLLKYATWFEL
jgi:hypothetical protein